MMSSRTLAHRTCLLYPLVVFLLFFSMSCQQPGVIETGLLTTERLVTPGSLLLVSTIGALLVLAGGWLYFHRVEVYFADVI